MRCTAVIHLIFRAAIILILLNVVTLSDDFSFAAVKNAEAAPTKKRTTGTKKGASRTKPALKRATKVKPRTAGKVEVPVVEKEEVSAIFHPPANSNFSVAQSADGRVRLTRGVLSQIERGDKELVSENGYKVSLSTDSELQKFSSALLRKYQVPWGAIVALEPRTGRILSMSSYSAKEPWLNDISVTATYPAASLFKIITSAAAIEQSGMKGDNLVYFRGGNYTLGYSNYQPDEQKDRRFMKLSEALGKSINPVFGRVAVKHLTSDLLRSYAEKFAFNINVPTDVALDMSRFVAPADEYELARAGAGFGEATISPLHAATIIAAVANKGVMMRPFIVDRIAEADGKVIYNNSAQALRVVIERRTSEELLTMLTATVELGTAKKQFVKVSNPLLKETAVAAKTGTLKGEQPKGIYHWFVAAAPIDHPQIAIATLVIDPGNARVKSAALAREYLEKFFTKR